MSSTAKDTSDYTHIKVTVENAAITIPAVLRLIIDLAEFEKGAFLGLTTLAVTCCNVAGESDLARYRS